MNLEFLHFWKRKFRFKFPTVKDKNKKKRIWKTVLFVLGGFVLACIFFTGLAFAWFSKDLPTPSNIANRQPAISTKIYDRTGQILLYETGDQKRTVVQSDQVSQYLKDATVSVEDANFYKHHGVDIKGILSAVRDKLLGRTSQTRGASTITQQYIKNSFLTSDRSMIRKIKEAILAVELEFMFSKDQILMMYLNEIPYGNATAGVEAAAKTYYGKTAKDLTLAESATLAAIPKAPTTYSPYGTHIDRLITRRNYVLDRMVDNGKITKDQSEEAKKQDTTTLGTAVKPRRDSMLAPHFAMYVLEQIADKYGEDKIQKEGLNIVTTLDYDKQKMAEQAITDGVPKNAKYNASNAALVSVDPKNGQVLAMVGSKDYFDPAIDGNVNVADSLRQPGSSFKPFAYATAFKSKDYSPSKIIYDFETDFGGNPPYIPHNYNGRVNGPVTMRQALANSLNIPAVKVISLAGLDETLRTASDLGITTLTHKQDYGLSLVLGAGEVKPVEMAGAFSTFATGGVKHKLSSVLKITDSKGKNLFEYKEDTGNQVLDPQIAYEISSILSDNSARSLVFGTRSALYFPNRTVAAKTGTTSNFKDAWTVGYTPSIAVAVWVGNSDGTAMKTGADGSVLAGPIFHNFIEKALANIPNEEFAKPNGIQEITVEKYSNKLPTDYSVEKTTDIFATWQVPTEKDDLHKIYKVCRGTDQIAPDNAPANLIEDRIITDLHSERPDNANWEGPVRAWASEHGMVAVPLTENCDISVLTPQARIISPENGSTISGSATITVAASEADGSIAKVEFFINDVSIGEVNSSPFTKQYNFKNLDPGDYKISVIATDGRGVTATDQINVKSTASSGPAITGVQTTFTSTPLAAELVWLTDESALGTVSYHLEGASAQTISNPDMKVSHKFTLTSLLAGRKYLFDITARGANNIISTYSGNFTTPLNNSAEEPPLISAPVQ